MILCPETVGRYGSRVSGFTQSVAPQQTALRPAAGSVRLSRKSHKAAIPVGLHCFPRFRPRTDGKKEAEARGTEGRWSLPSWDRSHEAGRCGRNSQFGARKSYAPYSARTVSAEDARRCLEITGEAHMAIQIPRDFRRVIIAASVGNVIESLSLSFCVMKREMLSITR
jgi:hypothetical protein